MMREKAIKLAKRLARELWDKGLPGHIFGPLILVVAIVSHLLAGLGVGKFMELINAPGNYIVELYFISLGGTIGLKWVKKDGSGG